MWKDLIETNIDTWIGKIYNDHKPNILNLHHSWKCQQMEKVTRFRLINKINSQIYKLDIKSSLDD